MNSRPARAKSVRDVLGVQGWRWLRDGELSLLPSPVRPARIRWAWAGLALVLIVLAGVAVAIGAQL